MPYRTLNISVFQNPLHHYKMFWEEKQTPGYTTHL